MALCGWRCFPTMSPRLIDSALVERRALRLARLGMELVRLLAGRYAMVQIRRDSSICTPGGAMMYGTAVVVGAGIGGLVTARVLADHFEKVVVFDRDEIPDQPGIREGAPQGHHFHAILPGGLEIMNDLFPGFDGDLETRGSLVPRADQFYFYTPEGKSFNQMRFQPEPVEPPADWPKGHIQTRGLLEHCLRKRLEAVTNVETRYHTMVQSLLVEGDRITGVAIDGGDEQIEAPLRC